MASILDTARSAGCFKTLLAAVEAAGLTAAIERTRDFFESMGIATRLSGYGLGGDTVTAVVAGSALPVSASVAYLKA